MNTILFDAQEHQQLLPLTFTKPVAKLRMGILDFAQRWNLLLDCQCSFITQDYLQDHFPAIVEDVNLYINPSFFPSSELVNQIKQLQAGDALLHKTKLVAFVGNQDDFLQKQFAKTKEVQEILQIQRAWDLFTYNQIAIEFDFDLITRNRKSAPISPSNGLIGNRIFLEPGATVEFSTLNATNGPIYLDKNSEIMEGSNIRGAFALGKSSKINMGSKIYGATSIGPQCKVGGEVNNCIFTAYSNKGHDGFLGNSVIGEWCNLGAASNNSNLKNNYSNVKMWDYTKTEFLETNLQFCGMIMGDHSKTAINSRFNTGTTVGVAANVFRSDFLPKIIWSFSWGGKLNDSKYMLAKCLETEKRMMARRNVLLTDSYKNILTHLHHQ